MPEIGIENQHAAVLLVVVDVTHFEQRRFRRQKAGLSQYRFQRYSRQTKRKHGQIMGVDHRLYIGARFIHFAMNVALSVEPRGIGCDRLAIEVYLDMSARDTSAGGIARGMKK